MKKIQTVVLACFVVFAFSAILAATASAETTLAAEWLHSGAAVTTALATESSGRFELEDRSPGDAVLCSVILVGTVEGAGKDKITEVLNAKKEKIELGVRALTMADGDCTAEKGCSPTHPVEVWPENLTAASPWNTQLALRENGTFFDLITGGSAGNFGYTVKCTDIILIEDTCTSTAGEVTVENQLEDASSPTGTVTAPSANCTVGGNAQGLTTLDELTLTTLVNGELLTASE